MNMQKYNKLVMSLNLWDHFIIVIFNDQLNNMLYFLNINLILSCKV